MVPKVMWFISVEADRDEVDGLLRKRVRERVLRDLSASGYSLSLTGFLVDSGMTSETVLAQPSI